MTKAETNLVTAAILVYIQAKLQSLLLPWNLHRGADPLGRHLHGHLSLRATYAIICTNVLMHQAIAILQVLDPP
jgi:hypothetical protein